MKKILCLIIILCFGAGIANAGMVAKFGIITDVHHTTKTDSLSRRYSAGYEKMQFFVKQMQGKADFIIELGDLIDTLNPEVDKDSVENFQEIESVFTSFNGPHYHVLGNHEFDNMTREDFLANWDNTGIDKSKTYYSFDSNGIHCIVLDADYTVAEPHRPYTMNTPEDTFWNWKDTWVPQEELDWLEADLAASDLPTLVFTHQVVHRDKLDGVTEDHTIKNADVIRGILEADGQVVAVFSGHDHRGETAVRNGIHYFVLEGNVGMSLDWPYVSPTEGYDSKTDNPFTFVEIREKGKYKEFNGMKTYEIILTGNAQQYSFEDQIVIGKP
nr:metallophosphoesterase [uncultured Desulfobacter sp.]